MKYCERCGMPMADDANFCSRCGYATVPQGFPMYSQSGREKPSGMATVAQAFMYVSAALNVVLALIWVITGAVFFRYFLVLGVLQLIPLIWKIPMASTYSQKIKRREPVGVGFKVCALLFSSLVAGILMFCDIDD